MFQGAVVTAMGEKLDVHIYLFIITSVLTLLVILKSKMVVVEENEAEQKMSVREKFKKIPFNRQVVAFFLCILVAGVGIGVIQNFLLIFLSTIGASQFLEGLSVTLTTVTEIPMFYFAPFFHKKLGTNGTILFAMICYITRTLFYASLSNPWYVLFVEPLHGITFASFWNVCCLQANLLAPKGLEATMQGIVTGIHFGIGPAISGLFGIIYDKYGARTTFLSIAALISLTNILYTISISVDKCKYGTFDAINHPSVMVSLREPEQEMELMEVGEGADGMEKEIQKEGHDSEFSRFGSDFEDSSSLFNGDKKEDN